MITIGIVSAEDNQTNIIYDNTMLNDVKTFEDIQNIIDDSNEKDTIELEGNYISEGKEIKINKSITISSKNGATLNAQSKSNIFNITNVNVNLNNLNIINSKSETTPAIYSIGNLTISNTNFTNNTVHIKNTYYSFNSEYDTINLTAGAIYSINSLKIINSSFENNFAIRNAYEHEYFEDYILAWGGCINSQGNLTIDRSRFKGDHIDCYGNSNILNSKFDASSLNCYSNTTIINSTVSNNGDYSCAILTTSDIIIIGCNFTKNRGYVIESLSNAIIDNCNFINNNLKSEGYDYYSTDDEFPAIYCEGTNVSVYNSNFVNNTGGAINNYIGNLYVLNSKFSRNTAYTGGAIYSHNTTVINSTFTDNFANFAGAIFSKTLLLDNCNFKNNIEGAIGISKSAIINNKTYIGQKYFNNTLYELKLVKASVGKLITTYQSGKTVWVKFIYSENKNPLKNTYINLKIINGKKVFYEDIKLNSNGVGHYKASNLAVGNYKIIFNYDDYRFPKICTTVKIIKAKTIINAPKIINKYKKSKYFKLTVKNKATKKIVKNLKVKIKVYTGKKYKTYTIKTNNKGVAKLNTKTLKIGKHKVVISSGNSNYKMSSKSTIIIKK